MSRTKLFIALAISVLLVTSCNNNKAPKKEVVEAAKTVLADDVLSTIDKYAQQFSDEYQKSDIFSILRGNLTKDELLLKPDYLLEPRECDNMITKKQKTAALAIYMADHYIRELYEMPIEDNNRAIAKLSLELNNPFHVVSDTLSISEILKNEYKNYKDRYELSYFWLLQHAFTTEVLYFISNNPEPFFNNISEEQYQAFVNKSTVCLQALITLSEHDKELEKLFKFEYDNNKYVKDNKFNLQLFTEEQGTLEAAKVNLVSLHDYFKSKRELLLK